MLSYGLWRRSLLLWRQSLLLARILVAACIPVLVLVFPSVPVILRVPVGRRLRMPISLLLLVLFLISAMRLVVVIPPVHRALPIAPTHLALLWLLLVSLLSSIRLLLGHSSCISSLVLIAPTLLCWRGLFVLVALCWSSRGMGRAGHLVVARAIAVRLLVCHCQLASPEPALP